LSNPSFSCYLLYGFFADVVILRSYKSVPSHVLEDPSAQPQIQAVRLKVCQVLEQWIELVFNQWNDVRCILMLLFG
jgi:hypothetical protein